MVVFPDSTVRVLGFDTIRARVASHLSSTDAAAVWSREAPSESVADARIALETVAEFQTVLRSDASIELETAFDPEAVLAKARPEGSMLELDELARISEMMSDAARTKALLASQADALPRLAGLAAGLMPATELVRVVDGAIDERGEMADNASPALRTVRRSIARAESALRSTLDSALADARSQGFDGGDQPTIRNGRMVIPIRAEAKRKVGGFVHDTSSSGQTAFIEPQACLELNNGLNELRGEERREIRRILIGLTDRVRLDSGSIRASASALLMLDVLRAKARLANSIGAVVPALNDKDVISLRGARHPILLLRAVDSTGDLARAQELVVPLDIDLGESANTLVLSGPNAGGKTVVLKTLGLFALMLSFGIPIPARQESALFLPGQLMIDIGDEQSVENDLSTFGARIVHLREIVLKSGRGSLVLIDEAGSGTDPVEGSALAQSVLEWLSASGSITVASTHHQRLKLFAMQHGRVVNGSMHIDAETLEPTYRFQPDIAGSSYGLAIARREGLPPQVISRAEELAGTETVELDRLLAEQSEKIRALDAERDVMRAAIDRAERDGEASRRLKASLAEQQKTIKQAAARQASMLIDQANARIERTIREIKESGADKKATRAARLDLEAYRESVEKVAGETDQPGRAGKGDGLKDELLEVGDRVVLDNGSASAEVVSIKGRMVEINTGSMRMRVERSRLSKVGGPEGRKTFVARPTVSSMDMPLRLDLRGARVDEAVWKVTQHVDQAVSAGLHHVEILHGKGTGSLRKAIREQLAERPDVGSIDDAPLEQGGSGITVVELL